RTLRDYDMRSVWRRCVLAALITELCDVDAGEELLTRSEQYGRDCNMHLVDESGAQVLPNSRRSTADAYVSTAGGLRGATECSVDAVGHEVKGSASLHRD